jgi:hypothetical protein
VVAQTPLAPLPDWPMYQSNPPLFLMLFPLTHLDPTAFKYPNAGLRFSYRVDGKQPYTSDPVTIMLRGQFGS